MRKVSLEWFFFFYYYNGALTLKMSKMVLNPFCDKTLHIKEQLQHIFLLLLLCGIVLLLVFINLTDLISLLNRPF